jgi:hypothetical protein
MASDAVGVAKKPPLAALTVEIACARCASQ